MSKNLRFERVIDAAPAVVFAAFTSPGGQNAFYGQDDRDWIVESVCDLRVGGIWAVTFGPAQNQLYRHRHLFRIIDSPRRLVLATTEFRLDGSTLSFTTEFSFAEHDGRTLMTMIQTGLLTAELRDEHALGLPNAFNQLEHFTRAQDAPAP